jgi:CheY-like chemotaxis protein/HPt (histidine-containing phosphotransfer) domain-containing protein
LPSRPDLTGRRVLVVDDNPINRDVLERQLRGFGIETQSFADVTPAMSELARAAAAGTPWDVAMIDARMPVISGLQMARMIRGAPALAQTRLIVTSSQGAVSAAEESVVDVFMHKPLRQRSIVDALGRVLGIAGAVSEAPVDQSGDPDQGEAGVRLRILVAEDNQVNQQVALGLLRKMGHSVDVVGDGAEAVEAVRKLPYDLVLMDVQMPEMDGLEATAAIRGLGTQAAQVPIVAMTANAMRGDDKMCLDAGMDGYISKPIDRNKLADVIGHYAHGVRALAAAEPVSPGDVDVDLGVLDMLSDDIDPETVVTLLDRFHADATRRLGNARAALGRGDFDQVHREGHAVKGASASLGLQAIRAAAFALEKSGVSADEVASALTAAETLVAALPERLSATRYRI